MIRNRAICARLPLQLTPLPLEAPKHEHKHGRGNGLIRHRFHALRVPSMRPRRADPQKLATAGSAWRENTMNPRCSPKGFHVYGLHPETFEGCSVRGLKT